MNKYPIQLDQLEKKQLPGLSPGGVLPNMGSTGMCGPKG